MLFNDRPMLLIIVQCYWIIVQCYLWPSNAIYNRPMLFIIVQCYQQSTRSAELGASAWALRISVISLFFATLSNAQGRRAVDVNTVQRAEKKYACRKKNARIPHRTACSMVCGVVRLMVWFDGMLGSTPKHADGMLEAPHRRGHRAREGRRSYYYCHYYYYYHYY